MVKAVFLLMLTGFSWVTVGAIVGAVERRGLRLLHYQIIVGLCSLLVGGVIGLCNPGALIPPHGIPASTWTGVLFGGLVGGYLNFVMMQFMGKAMRSGPNAVVWAIIQSGLVYPFLMGWLVFGEPMSLTRAVGIVLILFSIVLYAARDGRPAESGPVANRPAERVPLSVWLIPALLGMLTCGLNQCGNNLASYLERGQDFPPVFRNMLFGLGGQIGCLLHLGIESAKEGSVTRPTWSEVRQILFFSAIYLVISYSVTILFSYPGLDMLQKHHHGSMGYPVLVCSCIIGFFPYGIFVLKEKLKPRQALGALVGVAGIILGCL